MIIGTRSGLAQFVVPHTGHELIRLDPVGLNGEAKSGILFDSKTDTQSPIRATGSEHLFDGDHCFGVIKNFGDTIVVAKKDDPISYSHAEIIEAELLNQGIIR